MSAPKTSPSISETCGNIGIHCLGLTAGMVQSRVLSSDQQLKRLTFLALVCIGWILLAAIRPFGLAKVFARQPVLAGCVVGIMALTPLGLALAFPAHRGATLSSSHKQN